MPFAPHARTHTLELKYNPRGSTAAVACTILSNVLISNVIQLELFMDSIVGVGRALRTGAFGFSILIPALVICRNMASKAIKF